MKSVVSLQDKKTSWLAIQDERSLEEAILCFAAMLWKQKGTPFISDCCIGCIRWIQSQWSNRNEGDSFSLLQHWCKAPHCCQDKLIFCMSCSTACNKWHIVDPIKNCSTEFYCRNPYKNVLTDRYFAVNDLPSLREDHWPGTKQLFYQCPIKQCAKCWYQWNASSSI